MQFHNPDTRSGIVMAFRKENSPFETAKVSLKGLQEKGDYVFTNLDNEETYVANSEITISLPKKRSSTILAYKIK